MPVLLINLLILVLVLVLLQYVLDAVGLKDPAHKIIWILAIVIGIIWILKGAI